MNCVIVVWRECIVKLLYLNVFYVMYDVLYVWRRVVEERRFRRYRLRTAMEYYCVMFILKVLNFWRVFIEVCVECVCECCIVFE